MEKALSEMSLKELWHLFPIILAEHNPAYKKWYGFEKDKLISIIGNKALKRINHIGSTYVEELVAKPTVDILMEVGFNADIDQLKSDLSSDGWTLMSFENKPDLKMTFNKGYTPNGFAGKVFHLHVRYLGDWDELYFRDYLLAHKEVAIAYGKLKQELKEKYEFNRDEYTKAKTEFIMNYTKMARKAFCNKYVPKA